MKVSLSRKARLDLGLIWVYNADQRGIRHADMYSDFLNRQIEGLASNHGLGKWIRPGSSLKYTYLRRSIRGHAHVAVYTVSETEIRIVHIFHSAQDWRSQVEDDQAGA